MSQWQLLTIRVHYLHADGAPAEHVSTSDTQQTQSVSTAISQLVFSPSVWAVEFVAEGTTIQLISVDRDGVSGAFLVRATVAGTERYLVYSRRRGAQFTAELPTGEIIFTADQMFTASPQVFFTICATLDRGFDAALSEGWRWKTISASAAPSDGVTDLEDLRAG